MIKTLFILVAVGLALTAANVMEKRASGCQSDAECDAGECCVNYGLFHSCRSYVSYGSLCAIRNKVSCGCTKGTECKKADKGFFTLKKCWKKETPTTTPTTEGSGMNGEY